jgi:thiamine biosynthesis protein ThiS
VEPAPVPNRETNLFEIVVNGEARRIPQDQTLDQVLRYLGVNPEQVAVEKDRSIVRKGDWSSTLIQAGSNLEIVQFVGGG